jgi:hypothetical protein
MTPEAKIMEMFKIISEDPEDPNAPATMEGKETKTTPRLRDRRPCRSLCTK